MQKYSDTILSKQGKPVAGAIVTVTTYPGNTPATIYATDGGLAVASITSDENGRFAFYAVDGHYTLTITGNGIETIIITDVALNDPSDDQPSESIYKRRIALTLPIRFPGYADVLAARGLTYLFPQGMAMHGNELYILYGATPAVAGAGSYVAIYNRISGAYISGFCFADSYGEGIVVKSEGASRFLYARHTTSTLGKYDITSFPPDQSTLAPASTTDLRFYSLLTWDGQQFTMQTFARSTDASAPRNHFVRLGDDLSFKSRLELNPADAWSISSNLIALNPKLQSITAFRGGYATAYGGTHYYGAVESYSDQCGIKLLTESGQVVASGLMHPDAFIDLLRVKGQTVDLIENEGICAFNGDLYALWVTSHWSNTANYGIVITRELVGDIDCTTAAASSAPGVGLARMQGMIDHDGSGLKNPLTGALFASLVDVIEFMRDTQTTRYGFYTTNSNITDVAGVAIGSGLFVQVITGSYSSWEVTITGQNTLIRYWVTGDEGALTQAAGLVSFGGTPSNTMNAVMLAPGGSAKTAVGRNSTGNVAVHEFYNPNGVVGRIATLASNTRYYTGLAAFITGGTGTPEGVVTAPVGSLFLREDGGASTTMYVKQSGTGNTGWIAK